MYNIRGEKIFLRAMEPSDVDILYEWENDTKIWEISNTVTPFSRKTLEKYIESSHADIYENKQLRLMIHRIEDADNAIGIVDIFDFDPINYRAGLGILIAKEQDRNHGFASDSIKVIINYCFSILNLKQIYCNILSDNHPSIALFENNGFSKIGLKKSWIRQNGIWKDEYMLQLINVNRI